MTDWRPTEMQNTSPLDYQELRTISPKAARQAIQQILKANHGNISQIARIFGITRRKVYKAISKKKEEELDYTSRAPKYAHNGTAAEIEEKVILIKNKTNYGPLRLKEELGKFIRSIYPSILFATLYEEARRISAQRDINPPKKGLARLLIGIQPMHLRWCRSI